MSPLIYTLVQLYPLPEDHFLNQPLTAESPQLSQLLLLQLSVRQQQAEFTKLLVRAGARADMYNDEISQGTLNQYLTSILT